MMEKSGYVIFDFDGTVANSFKLAIEIAQVVLERHKYPVPSVEEFYSMRELSATQLLRYMKVSPRHIPSMVRMVRKLLRANEKVVLPISGIDRVLARVSKEHHVAIISSNTPDVIEEFLSQHKLRKYIDEVVGTVGLFQKSPALRKFVRQHDVARDEVVYIGDEVRDVEAAHRAKLKVISVGWGYNSSTRLAKAKPNVLVENTDELIGAIDQLLTTS